MLIISFPVVALLSTSPSSTSAQGTVSAHETVSAHGTAADPTVSGPILPSSGIEPPTLGTTFPLSQVGYEQSEYFISGTATSYVASNPLPTDGRWSVTANSTAGYETRVVVNRPTNPNRFNGTVVVEWLNVSGGLDDAPDWVTTHNELIRDGFAWVGVSAQSVGVGGAHRQRSRSL